MKKIILILTALAMAIAFCACAVEDGGDEPSDVTEPQKAQELETEPVPVVEPPIEISEFGEPEDMPEPFEGEEPAEFTAEELAITVGDRSFNASWLYWHNIYDWRQAGITYDQIKEMNGAYMDLPFTAEAMEAYKAKVSDFTMIMMLDDGSRVYTPTVTVGDEEYDYEWLASHNATEYTEAGIDADTVKTYLEAIEENFWYAPEYRWISEVYNRLVNGWE